MDFGIKVEIDKPETFLLVKETLTRLGVASNKNKVLYQSAHILHKRGEYYIVHFKELFKLDGKPSTINDDDYARRNLIVSLLEDWNLVKILDVDKINESDIAPLSAIKVLSFKDKNFWELKPKYTIGNIK